MSILLEEDLIEIQRLAEKFFPGQEIGKMERQGGMTNHTYKVVLKNDAYIFRLPGPGTEKLINRKYEKQSAELAARLHIDAELCYFDACTGIKIAKYIEGAVTMSPELMRKEENICAAAEILRKLHTCGADTGVPFEIFEMVDGYEQIIREHGVSFYPDYGQLRRRIQTLGERAERKQCKVPCHNDPLCENWIRGEGRMYLVDWEYAGMNDPMWDLADLSIEAEYSNEMEAQLLKAYFEREADRDEYFRFQINKVYLDFLWSLWGKARVPFGGQEMEEYALERYQRMKKNLEKL